MLKKAIVYLWLLIAFVIVIYNNIKGNYIMTPWNLPFDQTTNYVFYGSAVGLSAAAMYILFWPRK